MFKLGIIGRGSRMTHISNLLVKTGKCCISYIADPRIDEIKKELTEQGYDISEIMFFPDADSMLSAVKPDGVCIGTRCSLHTSLAKKVIERGIPLYLEKPVCTNEDDLDTLCALAQKFPDAARRVTVSFPLRMTAHVNKVKEIIASGAIGKLSQIQAWNNVSYGIGYYHKWYRDAGETAGQFLQKSTHDFDYINDLCGLKPVSICAVSSSVIFGQSEPEGKFCRSCDKKVTCPDYTPITNRDTSPFDHCVYGKDATIEDSDSAIIIYENGVHAVYTQNFVARKGAGARGARLIGHLGTVEFDWVKNHVILHRHFNDSSETFEIKSGNDHFGGDSFLVNDFISVLEGGVSACDLNDGIFSAKLCLAAKKSAEKHIFVNV